MSKATGSIVTFNRYVPASKAAPAANVPTPATVLRDAGNGILDLAFLNPAKSSLLSSADWRDAFDRSTSVPEQDSVESHHGWEDDSPLASLAAAQKEVATLKAMLSQSGSLEASANKLKDFLMTNFKSETGNETPVDCAIRLLSKQKSKPATK